MEKTVKILLLESVAGTEYSYSKGENDVPESIAASLVGAGLARYLGAPPVENAASKTAKGAEKRTVK